MDDLHSLVYVSSAAKAVTVADLRHLLQRARQRNLRCQVTGALLFDAGSFMQYIEGPQAGLQEVYGHIKRDPLHHGIIELCFEPCPTRLFDDWAMGARVSNAVEFSDAWLHDRLLDVRIAGLVQTTSVAAALLHGFWNRSHRGLSRAYTQGEGGG